MKSKRMVIAAIIIGILVLGIGGYAVFAKNNGAIAVKVFSAKKDNLFSGVSATGIVQEEGRYNIYINTPIRITKLNVKKGDRVKKGDVLAEVDTNGLKIQLDEARAAYNIEKVNLDNLKNNQGDRDTIKANSDASVAQTDLRQKQLVYDQAKAKFEDKKKLYDSNAISKQELDDCQQISDNALIAVEGARRVYDSAVYDTSKTAGSQQAQVEMQTNKLSIAELKVKELVENMKDVDIAKGQIIAPSDGSIALMGIKEGDTTKANEIAISIVNLDQLIINAKIPENDIKDIKSGDKVEISGDSIDPEKYEGVVRSVAPVAIKEMVDKTEQTVVDVEILVVSKNTLLKPGFNVDIKVETKNLQNVLSILNDSVKEDKDRKKYAYIVENGKAKKVDFEVLIKSETNTGIKESKDGIKEHSSVIYSSSGSLKEGSPVKVIEVKK